MSAIFAPALPFVKPASLPVPTVAEQALADRLAFAADGGDPDDYRPEWKDDRPYEPTLAERWEEFGHTLGLCGSIVEVTDAYPDATPRDLTLGSLAFSEGNYRGFREFAKQVGYSRGLAGEPSARTDLIPARFENAFGMGWEDGHREFKERAKILADFHQKLDWERAYEIEQRDIEAFNRTAGGWDRAGNVALI